MDRLVTGALRARVGSALLVVVLAALLVAAGEGTMRVAGLLRTGAWPVTRAARFYDAVRATVGALYRAHPYLNAAGRGGAHVVDGEHRASFNSLGYRSPERPAAKPPGTRRIVCAGGSSTFDTRVTTDEDSWPWQLERRLAGRTPVVQVWNAGCPGWTSLENLISLEIRDVDLRPDLVVLFQGINDLQPAGFVPFDPQYATFHPEIVRRSLVIDPPPLPVWERSLLFEWARGLVLGPRTMAMAPVRSRRTSPTSSVGFRACTDAPRPASSSG